MTRDVDQQMTKLSRAWTRKLLEMAVFMTLCLMVDSLRYWPSIVAVPESWRVVLGRPPEAVHISTILLLYGFSVLVLMAAASVPGKIPEQTWKHLGYRCGFILFYACSGKISACFSLLIAVCLCLYVAELGHLWLLRHHYQQQRLGGISGRI